MGKRFFIQTIKGKRLELIEEKSTASSSDVLEICEPSQTNNDDDNKLVTDKVVQVNIETKYRSKDLQVNFVKIRGFLSEGFKVGRPDIIYLSYQLKLKT